MSDDEWEADQEERIDDAEAKLRDLKKAGHKVKSIGSGPRTASGRSDVGGPGVRENVKEAFFKVNIPNVAPTFVEAGSAAAVKMNMRKIMKPDAIKELEIERVTPAAMKQMYRDMAKGKEAEVDENNKMDALKLALAKHKFKKKGGKVDKQPDSMEKPYGKLSKDDLERAKAIAQYKKDKKKKK